MTGVVQWRAEGAVAVIEVDNPPANLLSMEIRAGLADALARAASEDGIAAIVLGCAGKTFIAGADIKEFGKPAISPTLPDLIALIENSSKPVVAALHGTALGGGLEIALAAHFRLAAADAKVGFPEVKLGLVPGAGGTQRLPRLIGVPAAIELIGSGRHVGAEEARHLGIVDAIAEGDLVAAAIERAKALAGSALRRTGSLPVPPFDRDATAASIAALEAKSRGQPAPGEAARLVLAAADLALDQGLACERTTFVRLRESEASQALRHLFFAERQAAKIPQIAGVAPRPVATIGIVGAGLMGSGIALAAADAGYEVIAVDQTEQAIAAGAGRIEATYARAVKSGRIDAATGADRRGKIALTTDPAALGAAEFVIEAVFDDLAVKRDLFRRLDAILRPDAVLATNTSYLDPNVLGAATERPERVIGLHFFSPANVMRLVELIRTDRAAPDALATGFAVARRMGKLPILAGVCDGFIGNRIYTAYRRKCEFMVEDGMLPHEIDAALEAHGFALGPFATQDMTGHEIAWARRRRLDATRDPSERYTDIPDRLYAAGRLGRKTGRGWYAYADGGRAPDPAVTAIIEAASAEKGIARTRLEPAAIVARVIATMADTGARLLDEGVALRAGDIDLVLVNGYGYPAWRGGPMFEAERLGLATVR